MKIEGNPNLRNALQRITDELIGEKLHHQIEAINQLPFTHTVSLIKEYPHAQKIDWDDPSTWKFNCYQYAFDLHPWPKELIRYIKPLTNDEITKIFALIVNRLQRVTELPPNAEVLIIYHSGGDLKHAGKLTQDGMVISKWGFCHLWKHAFDEVPSVYGDSFSLFIPLNKEIYTEILLTKFKEE